VQVRGLEAQRGELQQVLQDKEGAVMELTLRCDMLRARVADLEASAPSNDQQGEQVHLL
jgi:hypothetical protein